MEEFLKHLLGKKIDVVCGTGPVVRGDVVDVKAGILYMRDEHENVAYVSIEKISVIFEPKDDLQQKLGFLSKK